MPQEAGYQGQLISLGGVLGQPNRGRQVTMSWPSVNTIPVTQILQSNPRRISALIQNYDATAGEVFINLGDQGMTVGHRLGYRDSLQIDKNFPWTGALYGIGSTLLQVVITEVNVP